ncbi:hypothetical protein FISHEDRAFT_7125, partial [Fistulina hepatica ATCC 64428]
PKNCEELYNLCHAQARNVIEHIFGVVKECWAILVHPSHFNMQVQLQIPSGLGAVHNFILAHDPND